jgi:subtilisin family serine protease
MACPVVVGTAAFLLEYFPYLTPQQLRYCIMKSAVAPGVKVNKPGTDETVNMSDISQSGGIINAYEAAKVAATLKPGGKIPAPAKPSPKPTLKNKKG